MKKRSLKFNDKAKDFLKSMCFLSPSLLGVGVFFIIPFFVVVYYSVIDNISHGFRRKKKQPETAVETV